MKRTVLVVDDSTVNRKILKRILDDDYQVIEAANGREALDMLRENKGIISAVLLDIIMPIMDGYAFLEIVQKDADLARIPIIVTTQKEGDESEVQALSRGATDFLSKPYKPLIIKHRLANTIKNRETAAFINLVERDALTGIYSKEFFYHACEGILANNPDVDYDIIFADLERFKLINDLFGVSGGDGVLRHVARVLLEENHLAETCGRVGSDQFGILIRRPPHVEAFLDGLSRKVSTFDPRMNIVMRYGIYEVSDRSIPISVMCDRARIAAQSIKGRFGTYAAYYDKSLRDKMILEQTLTTNLEESLESGQFEMYLQPKCEITTGKIVGAEALVRWNHPTEGFLPPAAFVPLFEKNGFITQLDRYVFDQACNKLKSWIDAGRESCDISINLSRADLYTSDLLKDLLTLTENYGISPDLLHLEITETAYTEDPEQITSVIKLLRDHGFIVEMDDFGTGYSSLNMLADLPIDILKLDLRFLQNDNSQQKQTVIKFVIELAKALDLTVIAEGVETSEQAKLLESCHCEYAQGYLYAKPMPQDKFDQFWESANTKAQAPHQGGVS